MIMEHTTWKQVRALAYMAFLLSFCSFMATAAAERSNGAADNPPAGQPLASWPAGRVHPHGATRSPETGHSSGDRRQGIGDRR